MITILKMADGTASIVKEGCPMSLTSMSVEAAKESLVATGTPEAQIVVKIYPDCAGRAPVKETKETKPKGTEKK